MITEEEVEKLVKDEFAGVYGFDPMTIIMLISLIISAIRLINECRATKAVVRAAAKRKGLAYRTFVNKALINPLVEHGMSKEQAEDIVESLRKEFLKREE